MITAETITDAQLRDACAVSTDAERGEFGTAPNLYYLASRVVDDPQAPSLYGDLGVRNTIEARVRCAEILNARAHTTRIETETRGAQVGNSELHRYHRWSCSCGAVGPWGHSLWAKGSIRSAEQSAQCHVVNARAEEK